VSLDGEETTVASPALQPVIAQVKGRTFVAYEQNGEVRLLINSQSSQSIGPGKAPVIASNADGTAYLSWEGATGGIFITPAIAE
jgi:hypothetical protein